MGKGKVPENSAICLCLLQLRGSQGQGPFFGTSSLVFNRLPFSVEQQNGNVAFCRSNNGFVTAPRPAALH
jgi:hypothetical protein